MSSTPALPSRLCRYRAFDTDRRQAEVYDLLLGRLRFSRMATFNDPFEGRPLHVPAYADAGKQRAAMLAYLTRICPIPGSRTQARAWANQALGGRTMAELVDYLGDQMGSLRDEGTLLCMSHESTIGEPLQWAHYADCHRGLAIHLSTEIMPVHLAMPVEYGDEYPTDIIPRTNREDWAGVVALFLRKSSHWRYEQEYRAIRVDFQNAQSAGDLNVRWEGDVALADPRVVRAVTLGALMLPEHRTMLITWIRQHAPNVEVWQAGLHRNRYEVIRERVT